MKTSSKTLLFLAVPVFLFSCNNGYDPLVGQDVGKLVYHSIEECCYITLPFEASFTGEYLSAEADIACGECNIDSGYCWGSVKISITGACHPLDTFSGLFEFCCDFINGYYPGDHSLAYMIDSENDTLFVRAMGQVIDGRTANHPEYVTSYWKDPFQITGGTGKYLNATGTGMTDDYNSRLDPYSHHHWSGTIILPEENYD